MKKMMMFFSNNDTAKNNNDNSTSQSYFNELISLYDRKSRKPLLDWNEPLFGHKRTSFQKVLENANKTIEKSTSL
jgi:hypothetical protein